MTLTFCTGINDAIAQSLQTARVLLILITPTSLTPAATAEDPPRWPHTLPAFAGANGTVSDANTVGLQLARDSPDYTLFSQIFQIDAAGDSNSSCLVFIHQGAVRLVLREGDDDAQIAKVYSTPAGPPAESALEEPAPAAQTAAGSIATSPPAQFASPVSTSAAVAHDTELSALGPESAATPPTAAANTLSEHPPPADNKTNKNAKSKKTTGTSPTRSATTPSGADSSTSPPATASPTTTAAAAAAPGPAKKPNRKLSHGSPQQQQERARILRLLESDRLERNMQRKIAREARLSQSQEKRPVLENGESAAEPKPTVLSPKHDANSCALQIRLFDGTPIKYVFRGTETLLDVRAYLDDARPDMAAAPYAFFLPLARKTFGDGEEAQELRALGLAPSATLVLKPATGATYSAYASERARPGSQVGRAISALSNALHVFLGIGYTPPPPPESQSPSVDIGLVRQAFEQRVPSTSGASAGTTGANSAAESGSDEPRPVYVNSSASSSSAAINKTFKIIQTSDDVDKNATYNGNHLSLQDDDKKNEQSGSK